MQQLLSTLAELSGSGIESYDYIHGIVELINENGHEYAPKLSAILETNLLRSPADSPVSREVLFTAYYALAFYYKRYDSITKLGHLINCYGDYFPDAVLRNEIKSWYYRRRGDLKEAFRCDRDLVNSIGIEVNAGPYISFASTVSRMLEQEFERSSCRAPYRYWPDAQSLRRDRETAMQYVNQAMERYRIIRPGHKYGKHYAILGRLTGFDPDLLSKDREQIDHILNEAIGLLNQAIDYEDVNEEDYYKRYQEYCQSRTTFTILRMSAHLYLANQAVSTKLSELDAMKEEIRTSSEKQTAKSMEILAVFTAVIALVFQTIHLPPNATAMHSAGMILFSVLATSFLLGLLSVMLFTGRSMKAGGIVCGLSLAGMLGILAILAAASGWLPWN